MNGRFAPIALTAILIAGCSGGGTTLPTNPSRGGASAGNTRTTAAFVIKVPAAHTTSATVRKPQYISASTQSISIAVDASTTPTSANLTPTSTGCVAATASTPLTCTVGVNVLPGKHSFALTTYDASNGTGHALSTNTLAAVTIAAGVTNTIPVILDGVIASIVLTLTTPNPPVGAALTIPLSVTAKDAGGNTIIGAAPYASTIALTDSDTSGATKLSTTSVGSSATVVTLAYNGSSALTSATISGSTPGLATSAIMPATLTPVGIPKTSGGTEAFAIYTLGSTTYAAVPLASSLVTVPIASGATISGLRRAALTQDRPAPAPVPAVASYPSRAAFVAAQQSRIRGLRAARKALSTSPSIPLSSGADECSLDNAHLSLFCISFSTNVVQVVNLTTGTEVASYTTDAPAGGVTFSGVTCVVCGIAYDPKDTAFVISTANGYEEYSAATGTLLQTIAAPIAENFGYDANQDQIFSAFYGNSIGMNVIGLPGGPPLALTPLPATLSEPDAAAIDATTRIAASPEEFSDGTSQTLYLVNLGQEVVSGTSVTAPTATVSLPTTITNGGLVASDIAIDSPSHLAFLGGEFTTPGIIGVAQMPASPSAPLAVGDYAFANLPNTPDGFGFAFSGDPHATATFELSSSQILGVTYDAGQTWVAVVDLQKLLAAPRSTTDPHLTDPAYDLVANHVVTYIAI